MTCQLYRILCFLDADHSPSRYRTLFMMFEDFLFDSSQVRESSTLSIYVPLLSRKSQSSEVPPSLQSSQRTFVSSFETITEPVHEKYNIQPVGIAMQSLMLKKINEQATIIQTRHEKHATQ